MMKLSDYDYHLPCELIAQHPSRCRDASRLLVLDRQKEALGHRRFYDIISFLKEGDLLVFNDTKVVPARLCGRRKTGGQVEILLLRPQDNQHYFALIKPLGRLKEGEEIFFEGGFSCRLTDAKNKIIAFDRCAASEVMKKIGRIPLPPYIRREPNAADVRRYQTVFAKNEGAVAAPTAGLHFTRPLLKKIQAQGVRVASLTLHVNYATFSPVRSEDIRQHRLEPEYFEIPAKTADLVAKTKKEKKRIFAVGTTVCKVLEDKAQQLLQDGSKNEALSGWSHLFITPPFSFKVADALITNFHLPKTTLLMLVSAFAGNAVILKAYAEAIDQRYRFYSYGDAMVIV